MFATPVRIKHVTRRVTFPSLPGKTAFWLSLGAVLLVLAGCWPFHHGLTPQEQYYLAVSRGDAITAAQVWTQMSPKDRAKLVRGEGVGPKVQQQLIREQLLRQQMMKRSAGVQGGLEGSQSASPYQNPAARAATQGH